MDYCAITVRSVFEEQFQPKKGKTTDLGGRFTNGSTTSVIMLSNGDNGQRNYKRFYHRKSAVLFTFIFA